MSNYGNLTLLIYKLNVDYTNGDISVKKVFEREMKQMADHPKFTRDNHFIMAGYYIFKVIMEDDVIDLEEYSTEYSFYKVSSVNKTHYIGYKRNAAIGLLYLASTIADPTVVIGIRYNGEMFYREYMPSGILEATSGDVTSGKTFIGHKGIIEQGSRGGIN